MHARIATGIDRRYSLRALFAAFLLAAVGFLSTPAASAAPAAQGGVAAADVAAMGVREDNAMNWARSVLGQTHTNGDLGDSNHQWNGWCDNFVAHAYGRAASGYPTAIAHYNSLSARGMISTAGTPPSGALVFYAAAEINGYAGHVMLSEGNGSYITTAAQISRVGQGWPNAPYLGWSWADPEWPGR